MSPTSHAESSLAESGRSAPKAKTSSTKRGDEFEAKIFDHFAQEIAEGRFYAKSECCRLRRKPKYFSRDRASEITFDISIEFRLPGATDYFSVVLIECKNYTHAVPVDDAEEFFAKVQQVAGANAKAVIASTASFQAGAIEFARSKGIGLLRFVPPNDCKWVLQRSAATNTEADAFEDGCDVGAGLSQQDFRSDVFSFYLRSPRRDTYSLRTFFEDILLDAISQKQLRRFSSSKRERFLVAPFRSKDELEDFATSVHEKLHYAGGHVPLDALCDMERERTGLRVQLAVEPTLESIERQVLGRIDFRELRIDVYRQRSENVGRARFTLAHELSHYLLEHGRYMRTEWCDASDFALERQSSVYGTNVARMEFQANYLAACLLLPKNQVASDFRALIAQLEIPNRGFGLLYVDDQACNRVNFDRVASYFTSTYGVSKTATAIRLRSLGLLKDARTNLGWRHALIPFRDAIFDGTNSAQ